MSGRIVRGAALLATGTGIACAVIGGGLTLAGRYAPPPGTHDPPMSETLFTGLIFAPLMLVAIVAARLSGGSAVRPGDRPTAQALLGLAIGFAGMMATVGDAWLGGTLVRGSGGGTSGIVLAWGAAVVLFQAASEEVFFRGWLQPSLAERWGALPGLAGASLAFAVVHLAGGERAPLSLLNLLLGGLMFGLLAMRAGGLLPAIGAHFAWNGGEQLVFGLDPNPGVGSFGALADRDLVGSAIRGGSTEGLNGSLVMTGVLLAVIVPLAIVRRPGRGRDAAAGNPLLSPPLSRAPNRSGRVP